MVYSTPPPPHSHTLSVYTVQYCTFSLGRGEEGGEGQIEGRGATITINVPVVFMARYIMVLRGATSLRGALEGVGPENRDFFGP
jgi:hypothetical protein